MSEERFSDLAVITMHYPERFEVDKICEAFVKAHLGILFQATLFDYVNGRRYVEKRQITIVDTAVLFNQVIIFGFLAEK